MVILVFLFQLDYILRIIRIIFCLITWHAVFSKFNLVKYFLTNLNSNIKSLDINSLVTIADMVHFADLMLSMGIKWAGLSCVQRDLTIPVRPVRFVKRKHMFVYVNERTRLFI